MSFTPKIPDESVNYSKELNIFQVFLWLLTFVCALFFIIFILSQLLYFMLSNISYSTEKNLFGGRVALFLDSEKNSYLTHLGRKVLKANREDLLMDLIQVRVLCSEEKNAFAFPGGQILITSSLLEMLDSENALVTIIAHEIGHIKERHHLRGMSFTGAWALISLFLGEGVGEFMMKWIEIGSLVYSQEQEVEADRYGRESVIKIYGHLGGASEFFEKILLKEGRGRVQSLFFSTHPALGKRLEFFKEEKRREITPLDRKKLKNLCGKKEKFPVPLE